MLKRKIFGFIFAILIFSILLPENCFGFYRNLIYFSTDKETYFYDECINISAKWELYYDNTIESSFIQIQIFNNRSILIWNSTKHPEIGMIEKNWTVNIINLNLNGSSTVIYIKFYYFYHDPIEPNTIESFLETKVIDIMQRNVSCILIDYRKSIMYGDVLSFIARFIGSNNSLLKNQSIFLNISLKNKTYFQKKYLTNATGEIKVKLLSTRDLLIGNNILIFKLFDDNLYKNNSFEFPLRVNKIPLLINISKNHNNTISLDSRYIKLNFTYFYIINNTLTFLKNQTIRVYMYQNEKLVYFEEYLTNELGVLKIDIDLDDINVLSFDNNVTLLISNNGTFFLENKTIYFTFQISNPEMDNGEPFQNFNNLLMVLPFLILSGMIVLIIYIKKKNQIKILRDISFRF
ncbi:MAG: hypothetical protein ACTSRH_01050 [Promethearchaeota archaeon]